MSEVILQLTERLLTYNQLFLELFQKAREQENDPDFHGVIKPFSEEVKQVTDQWSSLMKNWLIENPKKHLHLKQIDTTTEHIEQLSIQAFFSKTSKSRFLNANRTVEFFLQEIIKEFKH